MQYMRAQSVEPFATCCCSHDIGRQKHLAGRHHLSLGTRDLQKLWKHSLFQCCDGRSIEVKFRPRVGARQWLTLAARRNYLLGIHSETSAGDIGLLRPNSHDDHCTQRRCSTHYYSRPVGRHLQRRKRCVIRMVPRLAWPCWWPHSKSFVSCQTPHLRRRA